MFSDSYSKPRKSVSESYVFRCLLLHLLFTPLPPLSFSPDAPSSETLISTQKLYDNTSPSLYIHSELRFYSIYYLCTHHIFRLHILYTLNIKTLYNFILTTIVLPLFITLLTASQLSNLTTSPFLVKLNMSSILTPFVRQLSA